MNFSKSAGLAKRKKQEHASCSWSIRFYELGRDKQTNRTFHAAKCKSMDQNGMEMTSIIPLTPKRFVLVDLDLKALEAIVPAKNLFLVSGKHILTQVEWRHLNLETSLFEARLKFIEVSRAEEFELVFKQTPD
ncbi:MAG TPA: hypothetical protein VJA00_00270 [Candidatus Omnitrophota bacterium]|nr:hypothetical protein [Candidatus Omnitrophota bacterium]